MRSSSNHQNANAPNLSELNRFDIGVLAVWRLILCGFVLLLSTPPAGASTVSILSLLSPRWARVELKTAAALSLAGEKAPQRSEVLSGARLEVKRSGSKLLLNNNQSVDEATLTCDGGCIAEISVSGKSRLYHGNLQFGPNDNNTIDIVLSIDNEELTASVLESERFPQAPPEALRAMAVVVRSFITAGRRHSKFDFCDTTHCEVFQGLSPSAEVRDATRATAGIVLLYRNAPFRPYFTRSCGGRTSTYLEVWGNNSPDYPFFPVACPCSEHGSGWTTQLPAATLSRITGVRDAKLARDGNWISVFNAGFTHRYSAENFRTLLGRANGWKILPANQFAIREKPGAWIFTGRGAGHGVGFCELGAGIMAQQGLDYRTILARYFPDTTIEVKK